MLPTAAIIGHIATARSWRAVESREARSTANPIRRRRRPRASQCIPNDLLAITYYALGIDLDTEIRNHLNQPKELVKGKVVTELWS